jgi:hypothetical protein
VNYKRNCHNQMPPLPIPNYWAFVKLSAAALVLHNHSKEVRAGAEKKLRFKMRIA